MENQGLQGTARARAHILIVKTSYDVCESGMCFDWSSRTTLMCPGHRNMEWEIRCPYEGEHGHPGRTCSVYMQCDCRLDEDQQDELCDADGGMPCPQSPNGLHYWINNSDVCPGIPLIGCWATQCGCADEHVEEFQLEYGDGVWVVLVGYGDTRECDEGVSFTPLARLED